MANASVKQATSETTVTSLSLATQLSQPVAGTSAGSQYVCVVLGKRLNMAARITGNSLSVRVEPRPGENTAFVQAKVTLAELGIASHDGKAYASAHLSADTPEKALMGLAALMTGFLLAFGGSYVPLIDLKSAMKQGA